MTLAEFFAVVPRHGPWRLLGPGLVRNAEYRCPLVAAAGPKALRWQGYHHAARSTIEVAAILGLDADLAELLTQAADNVPRLYRKQGWRMDRDVRLVARLRAAMLAACGLTEQED